MDALTSWYASPLGKSLAEVERHALTQILLARISRTALLVGSIEHAQAVSEAPLSQKIYLGRELAYHNGLQYLEGDFCNWPIAQSSFDVVILDHVLEFLEDPALCIAEAGRVLKGEGELIILSFNPASTWGLTRLFKSKTVGPWQGKFISEFKLRKMLMTIDCQVEDVQSMYFRFPCSHHINLKTLAGMEEYARLLFPYWGAVQVIQAKKIVQKPIVMKKEFQKRKQIKTTIAQPTTRSR